jgi:integrase/recombinase XerD
VCQLVREYAAQIGIGELAPHDLRRTAAKLCRAKGGELEQIKFLLGHESILTTERYLGSEQDLKNAVNDALVFECRLPLLRLHFPLKVPPDTAASQVI